MVSFVCDSCQETVKKPKVRGHLQRCRGPVACIDCSVMFHGDEYQTHTQCVSEAQKYEGKLYKGKKNKAGGQGGPPAKKPKKVSLADRVRGAVKEQLGAAGDGEVVSLRKMRKAVAKKVAADLAEGGEDKASKSDVKAEVLNALTNLPVGVRLL